VNEKFRKVNDLYILPSSKVLPFSKVKLSMLSLDLIIISISDEEISLLDTSISDFYDLAVDSLLIPIGLFYIDTGTKTFPVFCLIVLIIYGNIITKLRS